MFTGFEIVGKNDGSRVVEIPAVVMEEIELLIGFPINAKTKFCGIRSSENKSSNCPTFKFKVKRSSILLTVKKGYVQIP